ncbi:amidohydrolase family protein [Rhodohalobacter sp. 614A]|uniref:amidohydrolase family protein n=1 Tax=Rhodohalobacter sp. 614A TaxID=2908649 RepID=UPI001F179A50|nr:amidohydrolase family protein [Rhodohalobacter sp. 614A]
MKMISSKQSTRTLKRFLTISCLAILTIAIQGCAQKEASTAEYYTEEDYDSVEKFNSHVHLYSEDTIYIDESIKGNFKLLTFLSSAPGSTSEISVPDQETNTLEQIELYPENLFYATTILDPYSFNEPDWVEKTIAHLDQSFKKGAIAVKIRKSIGMEVRKPNGEFVTIDDPKFDPVIDFIAENNKTLIGHIGEPKNCWLPLEEMTVGGDRQYYSEHPQYHMYLHPEFLSHEEHIQAVENMLQKHPDVRYVGAHLGSLEYDVDELAKRLDKYPNMAVDMAERISHFQYQAVTDWEKVRNFLITYQDRLIYATDDSHYGPKPHFGAELTDASLRTKEQIEEATDVNYRRHWKFFTTEGFMNAPKLEDKQFKAMHLPKEVVDKIYMKNAEKWFPGIL